MTETPTTAIIDNAFGLLIKRTGIESYLDDINNASSLIECFNNTPWQEDIISLRGQDGSYWLAEFSKDGPRLTIVSFDESDHRHAVLEGGAFWHGLVTALERTGARIDHPGLELHLIRLLNDVLGQIGKEFEHLTYNEDRLREIRIDMRARQLTKNRDEQDSLADLRDHDDIVSDISDEKECAMNILMH